MESPDVEPGDENEIPLSDKNTVQTSMNISFNKPRKGLTHTSRRRGLFAELEPIVESEVARESYIPRASLPIIKFSKNRVNNDILSQSSTCNFSSNLTMNNLQDSPALPTSRETTDSSSTPPAVLRKRIEEIKEGELYLKKELKELQEFTTLERQCLSTEQGYYDLLEKHSLLKLEFDGVKDKNLNLSSELEKINKLTSSQHDLIIDLKENLESSKNELAGIQSEKELKKELEIVKMKLIDEERRNELLENKWKIREDELRRSVEESQISLQNKEDFMAKLIQKVHSVLSEWQTLRTDEMLQFFNEKNCMFDSNIFDLFNLSAGHSEYSSSQELNSSAKIDLGNHKSDTQKLQSDLNELNKTLENQRKEMCDIYKKLEEKENELHAFNKLFNSFSYFIFHKNCLTDPHPDYSDQNHCLIHHENIFATISCEISLLQEKTKHQLLIEKLEVDDFTKKLGGNVKSHTVKSKMEDYLIKSDDELINEMMNQDLVSLGIKSDSGISYLGGGDNSAKRTSFVNCTGVKYKSGMGDDSLQSGIDVSSSASTEVCKVIDNYKERISFLENQLIHLKNRLCETEISSENFVDVICKVNDSIPKENSCICKENNDSLNKILLPIEKREVSCQTISNFGLIEDYENEITNIQNISIAPQFKNIYVQTCIETKDSSCQFPATFMLPNENQGTLKGFSCNITVLPGSHNESVCENITLPEIITSDNNIDHFRTLNESGSLSSKTFLPTDSLNQDREFLPGKTVSYMNLTLSDSIGGQIKRSGNNHASNILSNTTSNSVLGEFIELPVPDISTVEYSFSGSLEHSILRSKLRPYDTSDSECYDPLSSVLEISKPLEEIPILYSPNVISNSKILEDKCRILSEKLLLEEEKNKQSFTLLTEMCKILSLKDYSMQSDILVKTKELLDALKEVLDGPLSSFNKEGVIALLHNMKPFLDEIMSISYDIQSLKKYFSSLKSSVSCLFDVRADFQKLCKLIYALSKKIEEVRINNDKLPAESCKNLLTEQIELKENLEKLESYHSSLMTTSLMQDELLKKNSELRNILEDKDNIYREISEFKNVLFMFINSINELHLVQDLFVANKEQFRAQDCELLFLEVIKLLKDLKNSYEVFENFNTKTHNLPNSIKILFTDKCDLEKANAILKPRLMSLKNEHNSLKDILDLLKITICSEILGLKKFVSQEFSELNEIVGNTLQENCKSFKEMIEENFKLKMEELTTIQSKYSDLLDCCKSLKCELKEKDSLYSDCFNEYESLKLKFDLIEKENIDLKNKLSQSENNFFEQNLKMKSLEDKIDKLNYLTSISNDYSKLLETNKTELFDLKEENRSLLNHKKELLVKIEECDSVKLKLISQVHEYEAQIQEYQNKIDSLKEDNSSLKSKIDSLSLIHLNKFEEKLSEMNNIKIELESKNEKLLSTSQQLLVENSNFKAKILDYEQKELETRDKLLHLSNLQEECEQLKIELDVCNKKCRHHLEHLDLIKNENLALKADNSQISSDFDTLKQSYNSAKLYQPKYISLIERLQIFTEFIKHSGEKFDDSIWDKMKFDYQEEMMSLKDIISEFSDVRSKLNEAKEMIVTLNEEKDDLSKKISFLISDTDRFKEKKATEFEEINSLLKQEQQHCGQLSMIIEKYEKKAVKILEMLDYREETTEITDHCWDFIEENLTRYKNMLIVDNQDNIPSKKSLEKKIASLELELEEIYNSKKKFSKEIHDLDPDLKVSDLMMLSFDELQKSMLKAIMEKEHYIISDLQIKHEAELALISDRIRQFEEDSKRKDDWIKEIENENDRLQIECKKIQTDNENLKFDITNKIEKIMFLEKKIETIKAAENNSFLCDSFEDKSLSEVKEKKKSTLEHSLQEKLHSLTSQLEEKDKQCQEALHSLQNKSEKIYHFEKIVSDINADKAHLEEEVKRLKEELNAQILNCSSTKAGMEKHNSFAEAAHLCIEERNLKEVLLSVVEFFEALDKNAYIFLKNAFFDEQLEKIDKLNLKIKDFSQLLSKQKSELIDLREKELSLIKLNSELNSLKEINIVLKKENDNFKTKVEMISSDKNIYLRENENLKIELEVLKSEKEVSVQETVDNTLAMKNEIQSLKDKLRLTQSELELCKKSHEDLIVLQDQYSKLEKEIILINETLLVCQKENLSLSDQLCEFCKLKDKYTKLELLFNDGQEEIINLKQSNEKLLMQLEDNSRLKEDLLQKIKNLENKDVIINQNIFDNSEREKLLTSSLKLELVQKENELLHLQKEKDFLIEELNKIKEIENAQALTLEREVKKITSENEELKIKLLSLQKIIANKDTIIQNLESELNKIDLKYHSKENCPFEKELLNCKECVDEYKRRLNHEQETFKLWKINIEEDIQCKVQLIGDLEAKLKNESQNYKEAIASNIELHENILQSENKIEKLQEKIDIQRKVFMKEKAKLMQDAKYKIQYESKISELQSKSAQMIENMSIFLDKVSKVFNKTIVDLGSAFHEISEMKTALEEQEETAKQLDKECEMLNDNIQGLEQALHKSYVVGEDLREKLEGESKKLRGELIQNEKLSSELQKAESCVLSLKKNIEALKSQYENEKKGYEINIKNLLEDKQALLAHKMKMEKEINCLLTDKEFLQSSENKKMDELMKENNYLKVKIVSKDTKISQLEMRLESDSLPFLKRAEAAERKVEELSKELKSMKFSLNPKDSIASRSSPLTHRVDSESSRRVNEHLHKISRLEEEVRKLQSEKSSLKKLAVLRYKEIKELRGRLGIMGSHELYPQDSHPDISNKRTTERVGATLSRGYPEEK